MVANCRVKITTSRVLTPAEEIGQAAALPLRLADLHDHHAVLPQVGK